MGSSCSVSRRRSLGSASRLKKLCSSTLTLRETGVEFSTTYCRWFAMRWRSRDSCCRSGSYALSRRERMKKTSSNSSAEERICRSPRRLVLAVMESEKSFVVCTRM